MWMEAGNTTAAALARPPQAPLGVINLLKAVAAQLIVLHHLAFYGPMADLARPLLPGLVDWLGDDARIAVQVFLVVGGFLAAKSLSPLGQPGLADPVDTILRRYLKLAPPFLVAMLLAIAASDLARAWMTHDSISAPPGLAQVAAHALLVHDALGYEALSAGAWYVGIDFQLYALSVVLLWAAGRAAVGRMRAWLVPALVSAALCASLLYFNRDPGWDAWAPYFLGSYGLGMLAWWAGDPGRRRPSVAILSCLMAVPALLALALDFRSRIAVALLVACVLVLVGRARTPAAASGAWRAVNGMGKISYAVFLVHFPVCLIVNAAFLRFMPHDAGVQAAGMALAWLASLAAGAVFHRWVEVPLGRAFTPRARGSAGAGTPPVGELRRAAFSACPSSGTGHAPARSSHAAADRPRR